MEMLTITKKIDLSEAKIEDKPIDECKVLLKNVVLEITDECERRNFKLDKYFVNFAVSMLVLNPKMEFDTRRPMTREVIGNFVRKVLNLFSDSWSIPLVTLKMQAFFQEKFQGRCEIIKKYMKQKCNNTSKICKLSEIKAGTKSEQDILLQDIAVEIIVATDIGDPANKNVIADTIAAINSVMNEEDKKNFYNMNKFERKAFLDELQYIICGILVFNKDAGQATDDIIDLKKIIEKSYETTKSMMQIMVIEITDRISFLSSGLWAATGCDLKDGKMAYYMPADITMPDLERIKDLLVVNRQHEAFIEILLCELEVTKTDIDRYFKIYQSKLNELNETLKCRTAVLMKTVFPVFHELARAWLELRNYIFVLSDLNQINQYLIKLSDACPRIAKICYKLLGEHAIESDARRKSQLIPYEMPEKCKAEAFHTSYDPKMKLEFGAYCTWYLAKGRGILIPANPAENGVINYKMKYYCFALTRSSWNFIRDPDTIISEVMEVALEKIELIYFLNILDDVQAYVRSRTYREMEEEAVLLKDPRDMIQSVSQEMQTELHPIPFSKDKDYMWNVWDLRRKAIQLTNLRKSKTIANQTLLSYQTNELNLQTIANKGLNMQTMTTSQTNTVRPKNLITNTSHPVTTSSSQYNTAAKLQDLTIQGTEIPCAASCTTDCRPKNFINYIPRPEKACSCKKSLTRTNVYPN